MRKAWELLLLVAVAAPTLTYSNSTLVEDDWETEGSCSAGKWRSCLEGGALASFAALLGQKYALSSSVRLVKVDEKEYMEEARSQQPSGVLPALARFGDDFIRSSGIEIDLTPELTDNGKYQPRFVDEIYTELDTLELKHAKPNKQYELKKLFIPLLLVLKIFKLKLLLLLPIILGLASFKKLIAVAVILLPAIIAYFKVCKPDLGQSYGSYGHSSFYHAPPSSRHPEYGSDGTAYDRMSYRHADRIAYRGYRTQH